MLFYLQHLSQMVGNVFGENRLIYIKHQNTLVIAVWNLQAVIRSVIR